MAQIKFILQGNVTGQFRNELFKQSKMARFLWRRFATSISKLWIESVIRFVQPVYIIFVCNKGDNNIEYFIGLTPTGISVYQNKVKINSYFWPRINKLNYKSCKFMLTVIDKTVNIY